MLFLTYWFIGYAAVLFPVYWFARNAVLRRWVLLGGSAIFHTHFAGPAGVLPIVALGVATYFAGRSRQPLVCRTAAVANVVALVYYKYTIFLAQQVICAIWPAATEYCTSSPYLNGIVAPLAISFFVFEYVHYLIDVASGAEPIRSVNDFALFSIFWPSIVAGPVKRYQEFVGDLARGVTSVNTSDVAEGVLRIAVGYVKKIVADNLTAYITLAATQYDTARIHWRWYLVGCLGVRILLDFSGYTDLAIGFARMHGIRLPENFNWPYLSTSIVDFWRRWHMSLSRWIRDYIYIALGGSRCGAVRTVLNGLFTFALCGLWHGAGLNFLAWGVFHGVGLGVCTMYRRFGPPGRWIGALLDRVPPLSWGLTTVYVFVGWLYFFYPVNQATHMLRLLVSKHG